MSRFHAYLRTASTFVQEYEGKVPLSHALKQLFASSKKFGSGDRREISALVHHFFRMGRLADHLPAGERMLLADFVQRGETSALVKHLKPEWLPAANTPQERLMQRGVPLSPGRHLPWIGLLQAQTSPEAYSAAAFTQPDLFARIRPGKTALVLQKLADAGIPFLQENDDCLRFANGVPLNNFFVPDRELVIQDLSSRQCGNIIRQHVPLSNGILWDACAASGGKSLMIQDLYGGAFKLVVSDIRDTILANLKARFHRAGMGYAQMFVADLTRPLPAEIQKFSADIVLVDAPCSGSGTWSRTPEQLYFFSPEKLEMYTERQQRICAHTVPRVKKGGWFIYVTCSVFAAENQNVVNYILREFQQLQLVHQEAVDGTALKADSMYIAIFRKPY